MNTYYFKGDVDSSNLCRCGTAQKLPDESGCLVCMINVLPSLVLRAESKLISWDRPEELSKKIVSAGEEELDRARNKSNFIAFIIKVAEDLASVPEKSS